MIPLLLAVACAAPDDTSDTAAPGHTDDTDDTDEPVADGCRATPGDADRPRALVVSFPYTSDGGAATAWEVLSLGTDGSISRAGLRYSMGRAYGGVVALSPDGSLGVAVQDDGSLGVFTLDDALRPTVVEEAWSADGAFYAGEVVFDPSGERAWVLDGNWQNNGGGVYEVAFDCASGAPTLVGQRLRTKLLAGLFPRGPGAVLVAAGVEGEEGGDVWWVDGWPDAPTAGARARLFDYEGALYGSAAMVGDTVLVGDNSSFADEANRVAAAAVTDEGTFTVGDSASVLDPYALGASPDGDAALVSSGFGDALYVLRVARGGIVDATPVAVTDAVALPGAMVVVTRGSLRGLALVNENLGVRAVRFDAERGATDAGLTPFGESVADIPGAIGLQP